MSAISGPSRLAATVADESEELAAEAGLAQTSVSDPNTVTHTNGTEEATKVEPEPEKPAVVEKPEVPCETLYLQNLNEKVQIPILKQTLRSLFKPYRVQEPIIAHRNVRMRGQAFVTFPDLDAAKRAKKDVNEFPLYGKPIQLTYARIRSDSVVKRLEDDEAYEGHLTLRKDEKRRKRRDNPLRRKAAEKMRTADETGQAPAAKRQRIQMPDEYLPPNSVLFVQNLPDGTTSDDLRELFEQHAGLVEIRTIPAKKDIAFVEFADEDTATVARDVLHNFKIDGETKMKVTYARR